MDDAGTNDFVTLVMFNMNYLREIGISQTKVIYAYK